MSASSLTVHAMGALIGIFRSPSAVWESDAADTGRAGRGRNTHYEVRFTGVRVPVANTLGGEVKRGHGVTICARGVSSVSPQVPCIWLVHDRPVPGAGFEVRRWEESGASRQLLGSPDVRLGLQLGYDDPLMWVALAEEADRCGFHSVWTSEAYGSDAVSPLAWIGGRTTSIKLGTAIMQMPARTPATTAATIVTLDLLSGGRALLGLGTSGPQVAEGWHGQAFGKPLTRTREYISIVRTIMRREVPLEHHGEHYDIPYSGADATGLGKPLKIIVHPPRADVPIYLAAIGPKNVALSAEIADGWLPIFFSPERFAETHLPSLEEGFARRGGRPEGWDLAPHVPVVVADDVQAARDFLKPLLALYVGGMGARGQNFYNRLAQRYGYGDAAATVQNLYLDGKKTEAAAAVPNELIDEVSLVGDRARIADRLAVFRDCGATTLVLQARQPEALRLLAELVA